MSECALCPYREDLLKMNAVLRETYLRALDRIADDAERLLRAAFQRIKLSRDDHAGDHRKAGGDVAC